MRRISRPSGTISGAYLNAVQTALWPEGYAFDVKLNDRKAVHSAFVRFPELWSHAPPIPSGGPTLTPTATGQPGQNELYLPLVRR